MHKLHPSAWHYRCGCAMLVAHPACPSPLSPENKDALAASGQHKNPECGALSPSRCSKRPRGHTTSRDMQHRWTKHPSLHLQAVKLLHKACGTAHAGGCVPTAPSLLWVFVLQDSPGEAADSNGGDGEGDGRVMGSGPERRVRSSQLWGEG